MMAPKMARTIPMIQPVPQLLVLALVSPVEGGGGRQRKRERGREGQRRKRGREGGGVEKVNVDTSEILNRNTYHPFHIFHL